MEERKYIRTVDGNIIENNELGLRIIDILMEGDLVRIEFYSPRQETRVERLFEVEGISNGRHYIQLSNSHCNFLIVDGNYLPRDEELEPIITSIITVEKLESINHDLTQSQLKHR